MPSLPPQVYYFSKGNLKTANKQFSSVKNDYEITFSNETSIVPCEDAQHLPSVQFDFVAIGDLENASKDSLVGQSLAGLGRASRCGGGHGPKGQVTQNRTGPFGL